jgi:hypothetical protein
MTKGRLYFEEFGITIENFTTLSIVAVCEDFNSSIEEIEKCSAGVGRNN